MLGSNNRGQSVSAENDQYMGIADVAERRSLVMGIDFGTAYTKVVIADNRTARAIPFRATGRGNRYLLPSMVSVATNGSASLGRAPRSKCFSDLKLRIMGGDVGDEVMAPTVAYFALVMRKARQTFMQKHHGEYGRFQLDWSVNVGLPAEHCRDHRLVDFYHGLAWAAWEASVEPGPVSISSIEECFLRDVGSLSRDAIGVVPEFVAQICGYVRSPQRKNGAHMLVDVGGGTLDVAVFNVYQEEGEDLFPVFAGSVTLQGVIPLHKHRVEWLSKNAGELRRTDYAEHSTSTGAAKYLGVALDDLQRADRGFRDRVRKEMLDTLERARSEKYEALYNQGIRFFPCGGGASVESYARLFSAFTDGNHPCPMEMIRLPRPERFEAEGLDDTEFDRLSVAYGLSFDQFDIGTVRLPDELDDGRDHTRTQEKTKCQQCLGTGGARANDCLSCGGSGWIF